MKTTWFRRVAAFLSVVALVLPPAAFAEPVTGDFIRGPGGILNQNQEGSEVISYWEAIFFESGVISGQSTGLYLVHVDSATGLGLINAVDHFVGTIGGRSGTVDFLYKATINWPNYQGTATVLSATGNLKDLEFEAAFVGVIGVGGHWTSGNFEFGSE